MLYLDPPTLTVLIFSKDRGRLCIVLRIWQTAAAFLLEYSNLKFSMEDRTWSPGTGSMASTCILIILFPGVDSFMLGRNWNDLLLKWRFHQPWLSLSIPRLRVVLLSLPMTSCLLQSCIHSDACFWIWRKTHLNSHLGFPLSSCLDHPFSWHCSCANFWQVMAPTFA